MSLSREDLVAQPRSQAESSRASGRASTDYCTCSLKETESSLPFSPPKSWR